MLQIKNVYKNYGKRNVLNDFNLKIENGRIVGLLAPSGSGKSSLLKMIAGLTKPTSGEILVYDKNPGVETKKYISFLPEVDFSSINDKIIDMKKFFSSFYDDFNESKYKDLLNFLDLKEDMIISKISKGMRAKVKLLFTFSRDSKIVLLDEPLSGIDILTREKVIQTIVNSYICDEQIIIISTHEINEIEHILDEVVFIENGNVKLRDSVENLKIQFNKSLVDIMKEVYTNVV